MPIASTDDQLALRASIREWAKPAATRAAADGSSGAILQELLLTRCLSIAGGTTQILLSLVAERLLGLPREETR